MARRLHVEHRGTTSGRRRLVLVHGFTQTGASWMRLAAALADSYEVVVPDAPGHGRSAAVAAGFADAAGLLADAGGRATYVGYSMGGRLCLRAALDRPAAVEALVLVSATAGIEDAGQRAARQAADERLADRLDPPAGAGGGGSPLPVAEFLEEWLAQPLFARLPRELADVTARLANTGSGLASSLRTTGTGTMEPMWERLGALRMPVLVVAGGEDARFVALGERLAAAIPEAELRIVEGAGHAVPFEAPVEFERLLRAFLARR